MAEDVAIEMHRAALPVGLGEDFRGGLDQSAACVGNDQPHALQAAIFEVAQEPPPTLQILLLALSDTQDLPESIGSDANRDQETETFLTSPDQLRFRITPSR